MNKLKTKYLNIKEKVDEYIAGKISATDLKHETAPFGIYQQRNDLFMMRIRITGGQISVAKTQAIAGIMETYHVNFAHITSRQDLQLQDVAPLDIYPILIALLECNIPFRGGGGNTFRNILVSTESGLSETDVFDVFPYAEALNTYLLQYDKAFDLPRKLKIGFSSGPTDSIKAIMQDLGLIAKIQNDNRGFEVYAGGGMGKESIIGVKLFDFLPEKEFAKCAKAITDFFYDHGDRTDRNKARLRFVLKRLGKEKFIELFKQYFEKTELKIKINTMLQQPTPTKAKAQVPQTFLSVINDSHYQQWLQYAVSETKFEDDIKSLRLFIPYGNLEGKQLGKIANLAEKCGLSSIRLTQNQDIIFPVIHQSALSMIFDYFQKELKELDLTLKSFKGHLTSCIGAKVCKIGIADSSGLSDKVTDSLDEYFEEHEEEKIKNILPILENIRISGCHNACSGHAVSKIGLQGMKKRIDDTLTEGAVIYSDGIACQGKACLAHSDKEFITQNNIAEFAQGILRFKLNLR